MSILYKKVWRLLNPLDKKSAKKVYLAARSKGADTAETFTANDITGLRVCFRANKEIRITANGSTRSEGLSLKDVDRINDELPTEGGGPSSPDGGIVENPLG